MYSLRRKITIRAFKLFDLMNMSICLIFSICAVSGSISTPPLYTIGQVEIKIMNLVFFLLALFTWHLIFVNFKLYHSKRLSGQSGEILDVVLATLIGAIIILVEAIFFRISDISVQVIAVFWVCSTMITVASRILLRYFLRWVRVQGRNLRHALIIGTNSRAIQLGDTLLASPELGYRLIGFVDDEWVGFESLKKTGYRLVCDLNGLTHRSWISAINNKITWCPRAQ